MKVFKYVYVIYAVMAVLFLYDGIVKYQEGQNCILSFLFAGVAIFMFFFRKHFADKMHK
ncbi:hypothetical protein LZZ90_00490 [Flavobacterium sp. SM15]|uniref:hypothetical protein n=1 Tax=Flavobacterium sp. SM15 TaxID=2908005 RepID=UPI001EDA60FB|nr:hypothetical protein [Flavobacterium sp. SM15]MCG2609980.1 hypothetical protein [Flavobacterium sp. SM15]